MNILPVHFLFKEWKENNLYYDMYTRDMLMLYEYKSDIATYTIMIYFIY